jgi:hypothetical protein
VTFFSLGIPNKKLGDNVTRHDAQFSINTVLFDTLLKHEFTYSVFQLSDSKSRKGGGERGGGWKFQLGTLGAETLTIKSCKSSTYENKSNNSNGFNQILSPAGYSWLACKNLMRSSNIARFSSR